MLSLCGVEAPQHLQGQPFLGPRTLEREYIFATRDRYDESYDMVRAVRDKRYKYIRNYYPEKPYLLWIPYRNRHPIMQEMWRLHAAGKLEEERGVMFQYPRPAEELYDVANDRYELNNLASDAAHADVLERMRGALAQWQSDFGDMGDIPEEQMVARWYPDGKQPKTAAPIFIPINAANPGMEVADQVGDGRHRCCCNFTALRTARLSLGRQIPETMRVGCCIRSRYVCRKVRRRFARRRFVSVIRRVLSARLGLR